MLILMSERRSYGAFVWSGIIAIKFNHTDCYLRERFLCCLDRIKDVKVSLWTILIKKGVIKRVAFFRPTIGFKKLFLCEGVGTNPS